MFKLSNFEIKKSKESNSGRLGINIIIKDRSGKILFDEKKEIFPVKSSTEMHIEFDWLKTGKYDLIIDVKDLFSNHKAFEYLKINVN